MTKKDIYIVGAGTYGETMVELAESLNYNVKGFYDEDIGKQGNVVMGIPIINQYSMLEKADIKNNQFIVAIGNNELRQKIMKTINDLGGITPTLIHPNATVSPSAEVGQGVYIQANSTVWTKVKISDYTIISPGVVIAHHTTVGESSLISTQTAVGASLDIGSKVFLGMNSTIITGVSYIGDNTTIGAGAVVINNAEKNSVYAGVPAKKIR
ncbi:NeuD/PglB/VioB family sugar acetyltransferase [Alkalibacillus haloalkaliphilus]|uniref:Acetyltransferase n=1 Tax=Alkalibacillus haloalkaliphilus TaxID=94136 RepID=A0A511W7G6_9BACI|nr:NeuD/PglB/VioB family sugar acetyltransferase [Alkalibacillus haloalkaliphilus]GEN46671.1 acetyltransferase [Alkalibacillus haloalkaliphilus]